jgi:Papain-like cysteine protease AvrRpt2
MSILNLKLLPDVPRVDGESWDDETKLLVPGFRQLNAHDCGPVSVYSVVRAFHRRASYSKIYRDCNPSEDEGAGLTQMIRALRRNGVGVSERWGMTFKDVVLAIESGHPIIVGERTDDPDSGHWVVIYGYGKNPKRVFTCNQPNVVALSGREEFTWQDWRGLWDEKGFGLVCWGKR